MKKKILVVDDDMLTCQLIAKILELQGFMTAILADHHRILEVVANEKPDLIVLDYHLGTAHGLELLELLREKAGSSSLPVIIASGMDRRKEVLEAGAGAFLLKPFDWGELISAISKLLQE